MYFLFADVEEAMGPSKNEEGRTKSDNQLFGLNRGVKNF